MATERDWSSLPTELLTSIAGCLPSRLDILHWRAVCSTFRASVSPSLTPHFRYCNLKIPSILLKDKLRHVLNLKQFAIYEIHSVSKVSETEAKKWLVKVEGLGRSFISMKNTGSNLTKSVNLLDYRVKEISKVYELEYETGSKRVSVCDYECFAIATYSSWGFVVWRDGDDAWTPIDIGNPRWFQDIVYHKRRFYAIVDKYSLVSVDSMSLAVTKIKFPKIDGLIQSFFVKLSDDLFLVNKCSSITKSYEEKNKFMEVTYCCTLKFDEQKNEFVSAEKSFEDRVVLTSIQGRYLIWFPSSGWEGRFVLKYNEF